jgi:uncharacterized membrane protein YfcA
MKLLIFVVSTALSYLGWYLAEPLGITWAFFISSAGALIGVWLGWKIARRLGL